MPKHYPYSPSATERWFKCPGSVGKSIGLANRSSEYADEGTHAHEEAELLIKARLKGNTIVPRRELRPYVQFCYEAAQQRQHYYIEETLTHPKHPNLGGTADFFAFGNGKLVIADLKYGIGVPVVALRNLQLLTYAVIIIDRFGLTLDSIVFHVFQPRVPGNEHTSWCPTIEEINHHRETIELVMKEDFLSAGSHCRWCPAKTNCDAFSKLARTLAHEAFGSREELLELVDLAPAFNEALEEAKTKLLAMHENGVELPGHRVVERKCPRTWADREAALAEYGEGVLEVTMLTPAQLSKKLEQDVPASLTKQKTTKLIKRSND